MVVWRNFSCEIISAYTQQFENYKKVSMKKRLAITSLLLLGLTFYTVNAHRRRLTVDEPQLSDMTEGADEFDDSEAGGGGRVSYKIQSAPTVKGVEEEVVNYGQQSQEEDEEQPAAPVITKKSAKKKVYAPELLLLDPKPRLLANLSDPNNQPCGGLEKGSVHYLAQPGSKALIQWKVLHSAPEGNCTLRVGHGLDQEEGDENKFITLMPRDGSADQWGSFACGRDIGYEAKEFKLPNNITCDSCTLQFEFITYRNWRLFKINEKLEYYHERVFLEVLRSWILSQGIVIQELRQAQPSYPRHHGSVTRISHTRILYSGVSLPESNSENYIRSAQFNYFGPKGVPFEFTTQYGQIHQCADFMLSNREIEECAGKCLNGGVCVNGECMCRTNYHGQYCQNKDQIPSKLKYYLAGFAFIGLIIGGIFYYIRYLKVNLDKPYQEEPYLDPITGSNPDPSQPGRYGLQSTSVGLRR